MSGSDPREESYHVPVLFERTLDLLLTRPDGVYADFTLGGGGHSRGILDRLGPDGRLLAFDADPVAIRRGMERLADSRVTLRQGYFTEACEMMEREGTRLTGALLDLGVSSSQLDTDQVGLSWRSDMRLDMRFGSESDRPSAADLVNTIDPGDLATLLRRYGDEPAAWTVAQSIVRSRPIGTTGELRRAVEEAVPPPFRIKTLTRVFQALRIAVNDEMEELHATLRSLSETLLLPGGRIAVLTYHSLEDRLVKRFFRGDVIEEESLGRRGRRSSEGERHREWPLRPITRKPVEPDADEIERNPRARSARLRVAERNEEAGKR